MNEDDLAQTRAQWSHRGSGRPGWAVQPGPSQESVWDYPRPPRLESDTRLVRVVHGNTVIAESLQVDRQETHSVAWSYEEPFIDFVAIRGYVGFYPSKLECYVGEHRVTAQPGGFYGGWVTQEVVGPFKGEPGTGAW